MNKVTLYKKDNKDKIREWSITQLPDGVLVRYGIYNGKFQEKIELILKGKASRTQEEQIQSRINSLVNKKKDEGYVEDLSFAISNKTVNSLGLVKPMLALKYKDVKVTFDAPVYVQRKYDGNRCIIHNSGNGIIAYTRNGKYITTIDHILNTLEMPVGSSIDGELYIHGYTLQNIVSFIKREQEESKLLKFNAYDFVSSGTFEERFNKLKSVRGNFEIVPTYLVRSEEEIFGYHVKFRQEGYEGTIIRLSGDSYEDGKRSHNLLKLKDLDDDEFEVIDILESKDGWGRLICRLSNGGTFRVVAPGTHVEKEEVYRNRNYYIGKLVTVEYAYLTEDGVPFHPIAKAWRIE